MKIGDIVLFKADIEQHGEIIKIKGTGKNKMLTLKSLSNRGFDGDYIGGETITDMESKRCFLED